MTTVVDWDSSRDHVRISNDSLRRAFYCLELMQSFDSDVFWVRDHSSVIVFCDSAAMEAARRKELER